MDTLGNREEFPNLFSKIYDVGIRRPPQIPSMDNLVWSSNKTGAGRCLLCHKDIMYDTKGHNCKTIEDMHLFDEGEENLEKTMALPTKIFGHQHVFMPQKEDPTYTNYQRIKKERARFIRDRLRRVLKSKESSDVLARFKKIDCDTRREEAERVNYTTFLKNADPKLVRKIMKRLYRNKIQLNDKEFQRNRRKNHGEARLYNNVFVEPQELKSSLCGTRPRTAW